MHGGGGKKTKLEFLWQPRDRDPNERALTDSQRRKPGVTSVLPIIARFSLGSANWRPIWLFGDRLRVREQLSLPLSGSSQPR
ncbi:hypothetical protein TNCV_5085381 [Trichonephila clavipes]|uniref:Uncharacterized protein n=1 Tax=Trichonephila clavipes TaxID=2585209 RepID=A0A8X6SI14_TRICX|nr:hypothetical protein TNCV_5085381 [Trichonephila clavipes]